MVKLKDYIICEEIVTLKQVKRDVTLSEFPYTNGSLNSVSLGNWASSEIGDSVQEKLMLLCLDTKLKPVNYSLVSIGTLNQSIAHPRDILQRALLSNAHSIFIFHNHPSGNLTASSYDKTFTERLNKCCELMGIRLVDHIIVSDQNYYSFKEEGLL